MMITRNMEISGYIITGSRVLVWLTYGAGGSIPNQMAYALKKQSLKWMSCTGKALCPATIWSNFAVLFPRSGSRFRYLHRKDTVGESSGSESIFGCLLCHTAAGYTTFYPSPCPSQPPLETRGVQQDNAVGPLCYDIGGAPIPCQCQYLDVQALYDATYIVWKSRGDDCTTLLLLL